MIRVPETERVVERARQLRVPVPVVVRDLARIVEILNLRDRGFFGRRSVLAGGMAMRTFGSQRLTIYDADLSTRAVVAPTQLRDMLTYSSDEIEISPAPLVPTADSGKVWKSDPVEFHPFWLTLPLEDNDRRFKVDMAGYGVLEDGKERALTDPYGLDLWDGETPSVTVMRLEEIAAEKTLGWAAHRLYKHLADLAFIGGNLAGSVDPRLLRDLVDRKLHTMRELQPRRYENLNALEDVIATLEKPGPISTTDRRAVQFLHNPYTADQVVKLVREGYVPLIKRYP